MSDNTRGQAKDLVLSPNEYAFISDETKGNVDVYVGPHKTSLANTDQPVIFNAVTKRFEMSSLESAKCLVATAPAGWYLQLKNPAHGNKHPNAGQKAGFPELETGRKINIPGPASFALWPGQMIKVLQGHHLRSNQYLLVRVYDEEAAALNWKSAIWRPTGNTGTPTGGTEPTANEEAQKLLSAERPDLTVGKLLVIKGTDVSFYIPPTGIEVVADEKGNLIRDAVTLERLEFCLLLDQDGKKRYELGPAVVFPKPTEVFVERAANESSVRGTKKFRAFELNENSGIYIKVIADYVDQDEDEEEHHVGEELFITGKDQMIYFPREEHAIIRYGDHDIHYGIAIPAGEARYVLDRNKGNISVVSGPTVFLPDPRHQVIVRRVLDLGMCALLYPNNRLALEHNAKLAGISLADYYSVPSPAGAAASGARSRGLETMSYASTSNFAFNASVGDSAASRGLAGEVGTSFQGDAFNRKNQYTEPRTVTLNTKFDGAISSDIHTGYAMMVVRKNGDRRVVVGPQTVVFEYDETPQIMELSSGKPKTMDNPHRTVFLRVKANKVADIVTIETSDLCKVQVKLSYRCNFEGEPQKWFDVENYVKYMTDHLRSKIRNYCLQFTIDKLYGNAINILRDAVLGAPAEDGTREGKFFEENGLRIYDVEVLDVTIENKDIQNLLTTSQREAITESFILRAQERKLTHTIRNEQIKQKIAEVTSATKHHSLAIQEEDLKKQLALDLATLHSNATTAIEDAKAAKAKEEALNEVETLKLGRERLAKDQALGFEEKALELRVGMIKAEVEALVERAGAISPDLIAALGSFGERAMVEKVAQSMAPLSIIGGGSVTEILAKLLAGTTLAKQLLPNGNGNGKSEVTPHATA